nr:hypothetical protein L203_03165 [Cryptococcus depauperatus CBS 7841]
MFKKRPRPASVRDKTKMEERARVCEDKVASGSESPLETTNDDTERTVNELILLRKLRKTQAQQGIDLEKLNRGEDKKGKLKKKDNAKEKYGPQPGRGPNNEKDDELADDAERVKRLVRVNNFTQQTNALDVDKHMMAYIETELAKGRGQHATANASTSELDVFDPQTELFKITEKYQFEAIRKKAEDDGSVTNSFGMLTSIPEVDLGMDNRLKNIEETEKAKRNMMEQRKAEVAAAEVAARELEDPGYAAARFYRPNQRSASDIYTYEEKRHPPATSHRPETATDEKVYERFKKRSIYPRAVHSIDADYIVG